jgi:Ca2+-binding RTX toxin-like protein
MRAVVARLGPYRALMRTTLQRLVPAGLLIGVILTGQPHMAKAADEVTVGQGGVSVQVDETSNVVLACSAQAELTFNGAVTSPTVSCASLVAISVTIRVGPIPARNVVDLRAVTTAAFPLMRSTKIVSRSGKDTIYGSDFSDVIKASGSVNGGAGDDQITSTDPSVPSVLRGEAGADDIKGNASTDIIKGGPGNDTLWGTAGGTDTVLGGEGNDRLFLGGVNSRLEGGAGDDEFILEIANADKLGTAGTLNGGAGNDTLKHWSTPQTGCTYVTSPGGIGAQTVVSCPVMGWSISFSSASIETNRL